MKTETVLVTPLRAAEYLKLNTANVPVKPSKVRYFAGILRRGEWVLVHQGIAISTERVGLVYMTNHGKSGGCVAPECALPYFERFLAFFFGLGVNGVGGVESIRRSTSSICCFASSGFCLPFMWRA